MRCSTCGAQNDDDSTACVECDEPLADRFSDGDNPFRWIETSPVWLRWIIALPGVAILEAIVARRLEFAGLHNVSWGSIYIAAIALTIFAAAHVAAFAAPSYRKHVGIAIAFAELAVFLSAFLYVIIVEPIGIRSSTVILYLGILFVGVAAAALSLSNRRLLTDTPIGEIYLLETGLGLRWFLGIVAAMAPAAVFEAIGRSVSALWPAYLSTGASNALTAVIETAIVVALVAEYAPAKNLVAARVVAGIFLVLSVASLVIVAIEFLRYGILSGFILEYETQGLLLSAGFICGALIGLHAATLANRGTQASRPTVPQGSTY